MENLPPSTFKADEEIKNQQLANKAPDCMIERPNLDSSRQSLNDSQLQAAKTDLIDKSFTSLQYPRTLKFRVDPRIPAQAIGLLSFLPSRNAIPDKDGCFGVLKLRGNFPTQEDAENWSENLIRNYDSFSEIDLVHVGRDFPLMVDNTMYNSSTREIDIRKKVDDVTKSALRAKKEQEEKEIKEIEQRQQKLLNPSTEQEKDDTYTDIDFYIQLKVKKANAEMLIDEAAKKTKEAQAVIDKTVVELDEIEKTHPEYRQEYMARYENAVKSVGADITKNPLIEYMKK
jgi:hypothetical protein